MGHSIFIVVAFAAVVLAAGVFNLYRVQKSAVGRVLHLITAFTQRQYSRRTDPSAPGVAGELARAVNSLAEALEGRAAQAQFDSDHLLSLLAVLDHTNEIAIATDSTDNIRLANPAAARMLGRPADQLLGRQLDTVVTHPDLLALYRGAFHSNKPISTQVTLQTPSLSGETGNGAPRVLHCQATAATIYNGAHYRGTLLLLRDVTEVARTLQIKTDFVANASHELRTPLASILAASETLREASSDGMGMDAESTKRCVDIIHAHARRLEMIITDLLDLSRAEDPRAEVRREAIDLGQLAEQVIGIFAAAAAEKHVQLRVEVGEDARTLQGDERLLHLILKNLLDNAVKFTTNGTVTIRSLARPEENALVLEVEDTGCGISAEDQERVFERFYTVNRSRGGADRGTGLGLAIVKHATAAMGGQVSLTSQPGKGTTLRCVFPRAVGAETPGHEDENEHEAVAESSSR
jgi:two-component system phosphate regulon sensor histidine kinase PhoR